MEDTQSRALAFEGMVAAVFELHGFQVSESEPETTRGYDRLAKLAHVEFAIEARHFKPAVVVDYSLLDIAAARLNEAMKRERIHHAFLVVSCLTYPSLDSDLRERHGVVVVDRHLIVRWAMKNRALAERLMAFLNMEVNDRLIEIMEAAPKTPQAMFDEPLGREPRFQIPDDR